MSSGSESSELCCDESGLGIVVAYGAFGVLSRGGLSAVRKASMPAVPLQVMISDVLSRCGEPRRAQPPAWRIRVNASVATLTVPAFVFIQYPATSFLVAFQQAKI